MSTAGWLDRFTGADPKNAETDDTSLTFCVELVLLVDLVLFVSVCVCVCVCVHVCV